MDRNDPRGDPTHDVEFLSTERTGYLFEGLAQSRSDPDEQYQPRILLQVDSFCTCPAALMRDSICAHQKALLDELSDEELREWFWECVEPKPGSDDE